MKRIPILGALAMLALVLCLAGCGKKEKVDESIKPSGSKIKSVDTVTNEDLNKAKQNRAKEEKYFPPPKVPTTNTTDPSMQKVDPVPANSGNGQQQADPKGRAIPPPSGQ